MGIDGLTYCLECTSPISKTATKCPSCGAMNPHGQSSLFGCLSFGIGFLAFAFFLNESTWAGVFFTITALFLFYTRAVIKKESHEKLQKIKAEKANNKTRNTNTSPSEQESIIRPDKTVMFSYVNAYGEESIDREVEVQNVYELSDNVYMDGFCRERDAERTFRLDRIVGDLFIPSEGVSISPVDFASRYNISYSQKKKREEFDDDIHQYWDIIERVPTPANLLISYKKRNGERSEREIKVNEYDGSEYLYAFCKLRNMNRTFMINRIQSCIDLETGESVGSVPDLLRSKYLGSVYYAMERVLEKGIDILKVLLYIGKSDGQLRLAERDILRKVIKKMVNDDRVTDEIADQVINGIDVPSLHAFKLAVGRIAKVSFNNILSVQKISEKIVQTQKTVSTGEQEALDYLSKVITKNRPIDSKQRQTETMPEQTM